jgi:hypothetical protein
MREYSSQMIHIIQVREEEVVQISKGIRQISDESPPLTVFRQIHCQSQLYTPVNGRSARLEKHLFLFKGKSTSG